MAEGEIYPTGHEPTRNATIVRGFELHYKTDMHRGFPAKELSLFVVLKDGQPFTGALDEDIMDGKVTSYEVHLGSRPIKDQGFPKV
jgi:hypothetical protein